LQKAAESAPKAYEPRYLLGSAYNRLGRFPEAIRELHTAMKLGGADVPEVHYHLARAYGGVGKPEERRAELARFAELTRKAKQDIDSQRRAIRLVEQGRAAVASGDLAGAAAALEEAREARPTDAQLLFRLAGIHFDLQRFAEARNYAQEAISLSPSAWPYHYLMGLIERSVKRLPEARVSLETASRLNPNAAEVHNALGQLALDEGVPQKAIPSFERAVALDPKDPAYKLNLDTTRRLLQR
jgi:tetratricopeptide (TPR) repeat protein